MVLPQIYAVPRQLSVARDQGEQDVYGSRQYYIVINKLLTNACVNIYADKL